MNELRFGDLVQVEWLETTYPGLILEVSKEFCRVFLSNGLEIDAPFYKLTAVPMHPGSPCTANFAEALRWIDRTCPPPFPPGFPFPNTSGGRVVTTSSANDVANE